MAEDRDRTRRLDHLEMQYYRAVVRRDELAEHLLRELANISDTRARVAT